MTVYSNEITLEMSNMITQEGNQCQYCIPTNLHGFKVIFTNHSERVVILKLEKPK